MTPPPPLFGSSIRIDDPAVAPAGTASKAIRAPAAPAVAPMPSRKRSRRPRTNGGPGSRAAFVAVSSLSRCVIRPPSARTPARVARNSPFQRRRGVMVSRLFRSLGGGRRSPGWVSLPCHGGGKKSSCRHPLFTCCPCQRKVLATPTYDHNCVLRRRRRAPTSGVHLGLGPKRHHGRRSCAGTAPWVLFSR